ncbi:MAG: hypothetical protein MUO77_17985 [Anaerolineales bacterium]|nr:hypothetical protein [Anaerolineales bacterium]
MKTNRTYTWSILAVIFALVLSSCGAPTPDPTETPLQDTPTTPAMGRINGRVEFQGPPTPATALYVVNLNDPSQWFTRELAGSDGPTPFEIEVPAGSYQVYARQSDGPMAAAYLNPDGALGTINVPAGQVVNEVMLRMAAPQYPCQFTTFPASPDGRFAAIDATSCPTAEPAVDTPTTEALATIRGTISYQAPPTPTSMLYFVSAERWYYLEVPRSDFVSTFEWQVAPGTYQLFAYPVGSEGGSAAGFYRPASYGGTLTVTAGQVVENVSVQNINSDNCVGNPIPASPDGRFPALEESCSAFPTESP